MNVRVLEFTRFPWKVCREAIATLFGDVLQNESFIWKYCSHLTNSYIPVFIHLMQQISEKHFPVILYLADNITDSQYTSVSDKDREDAQYSPFFWVRLFYHKESLYSPFLAFSPFFVE
jgi:hypothetical protein